MIGRAFNFLVFRPVAKVGTVLKRKPWLVLLLLLVIWFLPSPTDLLRRVVAIIARIATPAIGLLLRILPTKFVAPLVKFIDWLFRQPACGLALLVGPFFPMLGFALAAWCVTDRIKAAMAEASGLPVPDIQKPKG